MVENLVLLAIGIVLWWCVNLDAKSVQKRRGQKVWSLGNRTWAWIVAITFVGLVPYVIGRIITSRNATEPSA